MGCSCTMRTARMWAMSASTPQTGRAAVLHAVERVVELLQGVAGIDDGIVDAAAVAQDGLEGGLVGVERDGPLLELEDAAGAQVGP